MILIVIILAAIIAAGQLFFDVMTTYWHWQDRKQRETVAANHAIAAEKHIAEVNGKKAQKVSEGGYDI